MTRTLYSNPKPKELVMKEAVHTDDAPKAVGPYSQAVKLDGTLYCSGQIPIDPETGELITSSIEEQTHRVLKNLQAVVEAGGSNFDEIIKTTIFLKDLNDFQAVNAVYSSYFKEPFPARACVQVAKLPLDAHVEIDAIAKVK